MGRALFLASKYGKQNLSPEKSKSRYEKAYKIYKHWCQEKGAQNTSSESVVLAYFSFLASKQKATTLWATYSMLQTTLNIKNKTDEDVDKLLNTALRFSSTKSNILNFFIALIVYLIRISGVCRSDELFKIKTNDIEMTEKSHYDNFRYKSLSSLKFYNNGFKKYGMEVTQQPYGHNSIGQFPNKIAMFLNLSNTDKFTGHCFRCIAATLVDNSGVSIINTYCCSVYYSHMIWLRQINWMIPTNPEFDLDYLLVNHKPHNCHPYDDT
ncbi:hypothetical protein NQ317_015861 [Molorchus minor]|uniref:Uncharacterized protein n=1 Tax=Molorchus minor TaxID=1323400 RepID=A0ABQ9JIR1_9CUCU|nr:hypothetical protein NQ317_015861 [Molorchus minor]